MSVRVHPATADRWDDLVRVFGRRGEDPSWCWCQAFLETGTAFSGSSEPMPDKRQALHEEVTHAALPPGLIGYVGAQPVGWTRVGPRSTLPGVGANRALAKVLKDEPGAWWVACFAVDSHHRHSGVGSALLEAAVVFARDHGATVLEGHPVDVASLRAARVSGAGLYTGTMAMFTAAGFREVGRSYPTRPVMRLAL